MSVLFSGSQEFFSRREFIFPNFVYSTLMDFIIQGPFQAGSLLLLMGLRNNSEILGNSYEYHKILE